MHITRIRLPSIQAFPPQTSGSFVMWAYTVPAVVAMTASSIPLGCANGSIVLKVSLLTLVSAFS
jgi:hypothetical protein